MPSMCIMYYNRINFPLPSLSPLPLLMAHFFLLTLPAPETFICAVIVQVDTDAVCMQSQSLWYSHKTLFYSTSPHPASLTSFLPSHPWCSLSFWAGSIAVPLKGEHSHTHKSFFFSSALRPACESLKTTTHLRKKLLWPSLRPTLILQHDIIFKQYNINT